jgi:hypothetical protein
MFLRLSGPMERNNMSKEKRKLKKKMDRKRRVEEKLFHKRQIRMVEKKAETEAAKKQMTIEKLMRQFDEEDKGEPSV